MKRALYIALLTMFFIILVEVLGLSHVLYVAFVAFPITFEQELVYDNWSDVATKAILWTLGIVIGVVFASLIIANSGSFATMVLLTTIATFLASSVTFLPPSFIFGAMGMTFANPNHPLFVLLMMTLGMILAIVAKMPFDKEEDLF